MSKIDTKKLQQELEAIKQDESLNKREMSEKMKELLKEEISNAKKREKTRAAEMVSIFAAHNFYANGFTPVELRTTLEDLGPTYVKIGQIMSSRVDVLPEAYCKELEKLRQNVKPLDADVAKAIFEDEIGKKIDEVFSEFRDEPLGSASVGQAHYAVLKDGTKVVVKVQRPLIEDMMHKDYVLLKKLAGMVNVVADRSEDEQMVDLLSVIEELEKVTNEELDFRIEAEHTEFFRENCIEDTDVIDCPTVISELTTKRVFTMTFVDGYTVSHKERIEEDGYNPLEIGTAVAENFVHQIFDVGTFHADPHQGNIMISGGKPYWIDFGMLGHISSKDIDSIQSILISVFTNNIEGMVDGVISLGATSPKTNRDNLIDDAAAFMKGLEGVNGIADLDMGMLIDEITELASKHHISLPGQFTMLGRAVLTIEGVIEHLCPELNLFKLLSEKMIERAKNNFDVKKTLIDAGKDILGVGKKVSRIPTLLHDTLNGLAKGKTKINMELSGLDEPLEKIGDFIRNIVLTVIACVLFIGSCILARVDLQPKTSGGMPLIAVIGIVFSVSLAIFSIGKLGKKK